MAHLTKVATLADSILRQIPNIGCWQCRLLLHLFPLWLCIRGRHNFVNLARYGKYAEGTYRNNFARSLDWLDFNTRLVDQQLGDRLILAVDPSYLPKSGKHTAGVAKFWSGQAQQAKPGLEICGVAAVDLDTKTALHLVAFQTVDRQPGETLLDFYARGLVERAGLLRRSSKYVVADAYFAKVPFIQRMKLADFEVVTRLRKDAHLRYLYQGPAHTGPGRPRKYAGRVDVPQLDGQYFDRCAFDKAGRWVAYSALVNVKAWNGTARVVIVHVKDKLGQTTAHRTLVSTDENLSGEEIVKMYTYRFQQEFLFRDAKQQLGLTHCQAYSEEKINFHVNTALTVGSLAKVAHHLAVPESKGQPFSIADIKTEYINEHQGLRILSRCGIDVNTTKIRSILAEVRNYGKRRG